MRSFAVAAALGFLLLCSLVTPSAAGALKPKDREIYENAFAAARNDKFDLARALAAKAEDRGLGKVLRWLDLGRQRSGSSFDDILAFIEGNPDWPQMGALQRRAEEAISASTPDAAILAFFKERRPLTADGGIALGRALLAGGQRDKAAEVLRRTWIEGNFGALQERQFLARFAKLLTRQDHVARLDRLLWDRQEAAAKRMILKVDTAHRHLAQARLALMTMRGNVESAIAQVPAELRDDPGLVFERARWRRKKDLDDGAIEMLKHASRNKVRPDMWWIERSILARRALQQGHVTEAYRLARDHGQQDGATYADAEWLAGWIALRFLQDHAAALGHFRQLHDKVSFPISRARAAYWAGRAAEAGKDADGARQWYERAAANGTTFYGQLAAARLTPGGAARLPEEPRPSDEERAAFERHELVRVTRQLAEIDDPDLLRSFVLRLAEALASPGLRVLVGELAQQAGRPDLAVSVARRADRDGMTLSTVGYPLPAFDVAGALERPLVYGLIRQESGFHQHAVSGAGARGLMQLLPGTAQKVAKGLRVGYARHKLTNDPQFNVTLGSAYLAELLDSFGGSYVLALAAYNAGPARVRKWLKELGDPRDPDADPIDWIEAIPFPETRNYVQRVLESVQVYRQRLGAATDGRGIEHDIALTSAGNG